MGNGAVVINRVPADGIYTDQCVCDHVGDPVTVTRKPPPMPGIRRLGKWCASARALRALLLGGRARARTDGAHVLWDGVKAVALPVLHRRGILAVEAESRDIAGEEFGAALSRYVPVA